jgi:hypothetical protein
MLQQKQHLEKFISHTPFQNSTSMSHVAHQLPVQEHPVPIPSIVLYICF